MTFTDINLIHYVIRQSQRMKYLNMKYPFIVLIDKNDFESLQILKNNNIQYKLIEQDFFNSTDKYKTRFKKTINKFKIVNYLDTFEKICFLDADIICTENLDKHFDDIDENIQFYGSFSKKDSHVNGGIFYLTNKLNQKDFLNFINLNKYKYNEDESLLTDYFINKENINLTANINSLHFSGYIKLLSMSKIFPIFQNILYNYDENKFNNFIDKNLSNLIKINNKWIKLISLISDISEENQNE